MAKENGKKRQEVPAAYFKSLTIENVKCFKGKHTIDLSDGNGKPAQWTVILGNNNTGKTTLLKCLAGFQPTESKSVDSHEMSWVPYAFEKLENVEFDRIFGVESLWVHADMLRAISGSNFSDGKFGLDFATSLSFMRQKETNTYSNNNLKIGKTASFISAESSPFITISYGVSRKMTATSFSDSLNVDGNEYLFRGKDITNVEDWLLNLFISQQLKVEQAARHLELAKKVLTSGILPDVLEVNLKSQELGSSFENFVEFRTDYGWVRLRDLGYGYQTMIAWVLDLVKRMVERYPDSPNPLTEPAIVLVDEIDLHLHPDWQRRIIAHLTKYFPNTQFIVTAHSPLVVQSADEVNLVILKKTADHVTIEQPKIRSFKGWTVEEILTDLMDLEGQTMSNTYLDLMQQFDEALDEDNYEKAKDAYDQLDKILHPGSSQRKLMKIQMTSLSPAEAV